MREIIRPGLVLLLITAVAAVCLGYVYDITKEPIAKQQAEAKATSMQVLLPSATEFKDDIEIPEGSPVVSVATGYNGSEIVGYVIGVAPKGYSGAVETMVGMNPEGVLEGIQIIKQTETPGLGANCQNESFRDQYKGKSGELKVVKTGNPGDNEIQAMTSSTITTNAVTLGVNQAIEFYGNTIKK